MYLQFIEHWLLLSKLAKLKDLWTWYMNGIYHAYTCYMSCIYQVFVIWSLRENYTFLNISCFNIRLSSTMALVYSIALHINPWFFFFNIQCIYLGYTRYIQPLGIYMVYTWYTPSIYLVGVPDDGASASDRPIIWNPTHLDRIGQNGTYVSEHGTDMFQPVSKAYRKCCLKCKMKGSHLKLTQRML